jgi:hypothetical protein
VVSVSVTILPEVTESKLYIMSFKLNILQIFEVTALWNTLQGDTVSLALSTGSHASLVK